MAPDSLWDFTNRRIALTLQSCKDFFRCSPPARQAGGCYCYASALRECSLTSASPMNRFPLRRGKSPEQSFLPERSALAHLPRSSAPFPLCCKFSWCCGHTSPILFNLPSHSPSPSLFFFWGREHFRLIPICSAVDSLFTQTPNKVGGLQRVLYSRFPHTGAHDSPLQVLQPGPRQPGPNEAPPLRSIWAYALLPKSLESS